MSAFILEQILQFWPPYREEQENDTGQQESLPEAGEATAQNPDEGRQGLAR
jgi:hypothetical protein